MIPTPPWWLASLVANGFIFALERINRSGGFESFSAAIVYTGPLVIAAQWGLFYAWRDAPSLMAAWAFFTVGNLVLRIANSYTIGEPLNLGTWVGLSLMVLGMMMVRTGRVLPWT